MVDVAAVPLLTELDGVRWVTVAIDMPLLPELAAAARGRGLSRFSVSTLSDLPGHSQTTAGLPGHSQTTAGLPSPFSSLAMAGARLARPARTSVRCNLSSTTAARSHEGGGA